MSRSHGSRKQRLKNASWYFWYVHHSLIQYIRDIIYILRHKQQS